MVHVNEEGRIILKFIWGNWRHMESSALHGSLKYRIVDTTSNVFVVMNDWFVLFKSETRFIERFWGSCSMVLNNTSPHSTPLPDWLVSLSCVYPCDPLDLYMYISTSNPCLEFMDCCIFPTVPRVSNSWISLPFNIRLTRSFATSGIIYPFLQRIQNSTNSRYRSFHKFLSSRLPMCNLRTVI